MNEIFDFLCCYTALGEWHSSFIIQPMKMEPAGFPETLAPKLHNSPENLRFQI
jgi:hypothetical protein